MKSVRASHKSAECTVDESKGVKEQLLQRQRAADGSARQCSANQSFRFMLNFNFNATYIYDM